MVATGEPGTRVNTGSRHRPPPKIFVGIGAALLAINHLSVVFGNGLSAEALVMGCWLVLMGGWVLLPSGRSTRCGGGRTGPAGG